MDPKSRFPDFYLNSSVFLTHKLHEEVNIMLNDLEHTVEKYGQFLSGVRDQRSENHEAAYLYGMSDSTEAVTLDSDRQGATVCMASTEEVHLKMLLEEWHVKTEHVWQSAFPDFLEYPECAEDQCEKLVSYMTVLEGRLVSGLLNVSRENYNLYMFWLREKGKIESLKERLRTSALTFEHLTSRQKKERCMTILNAIEIVADDYVMFKSTKRIRLLSQLLMKAPELANNSCLGQVLFGKIEQLNCHRSLSQAEFGSILILILSQQISYSSRNVALGMIKEKLENLSDDFYKKSEYYLSLLQLMDRFQSSEEAWHLIKHACDEIDKDGQIVCEQSILLWVAEVQKILHLRMEYQIYIVLSTKAKVETCEKLIGKLEEINMSVLPADWQQVIVKMHTVLLAHKLRLYQSEKQGAWLSNGLFGTRKAEESAYQHFIETIWQCPLDQFYCQDCLLALKVCDKDKENIANIFAELQRRFQKTGRYHQVDQDLGMKSY